MTEVWTLAALWLHWRSYRRCSVEEIDYMLEFIEEVREEIGTTPAGSTRWSIERAQWPRIFK